MEPAIVGLLLALLTIAATAAGYYVGLWQGKRIEAHRSKLERLKHKNALLDNGRRTDARADNGPPSRVGTIRYTGKRPTPGDKPPTLM